MADFVDMIVQYFLLLLISLAHFLYMRNGMEEALESEFRNLDCAPHA